MAKQPLLIRLKGEQLDLGMYGRILTAGLRVKEGLGSRRIHILVLDRPNTPTTVTYPKESTAVCQSSFGPRDRDALVALRRGDKWHGFATSVRPQ